MPIDASIPLSYKPVQTPNMLASMAQGQELGINALKMNALLQETEGQNAVQKWQQSGGDINSPDAPNQMLKMGVPLKAVQSFVKTGLEQRKLGGEVTKQDLDITERVLGRLANDPTDGMVTQTIGELIKSGRVKPEEGQSLLSKALLVPIDKRPALFTKMAVDAKTQYEKTTISAGEQARLGQAERHFQQNLTQGAIPAGYRKTTEGNLEAIPGGPTTTPLAPKELQTREAKYPMATQAVKTVEAKSDKLIADIETLKNHPGLDSITGTVYGRTPSVTAEGRSAQALYDSIVARGGFQELAAMRAASPTGGALGNVSNQEGQQLKDAFGTLNRTQDATSLRTQLGRVADDVRGAKQRVREAYDMTYDYKAGAPSATAPSTGGKADPLGIR